MTQSSPAEFALPDDLQRTRGWHDVVLGSASAPQLLRWSVWYPPGSDRGGRRGTIYESYAIKTCSGVVLIDPPGPIRPPSRVCET